MSKSFGVKANGKRSERRIRFDSFFVFTKCTSIFKPNSANVCRQEPHGAVKPSSTSLENERRLSTRCSDFVLDLRGHGDADEFRLALGHRLDDRGSFGTRGQTVRSVFHVTTLIDFPRGAAQRRADSTNRRMRESTLNLVAT